MRWFRDILPPNDDVPVAVALSDANHAVTITKQLMGPVHLNLQFRENLAPDAGPIRGDSRIDSVTRFQSSRFTDTASFRRWSISGGRWSDSYYSANSHLFGCNENAVMDVVDLILRSKRGIIVVGNVRSSAFGEKSDNSDAPSVFDTISQFAQAVGFPILAGAQAAALRQSPAVVPFAEHLLKHPVVKGNLGPDLILQIGAPLVSTEVVSLISDGMTSWQRSARGGAHVLLHPHHPAERADPNFSVTHRVSAETGSFLRAVQETLESREGLDMGGKVCSQLAPLVLLGRKLGKVMPGILHGASEDTVEEMRRSCSVSSENNGPQLTEPQIALALSEVLSEFGSSPSSMFLSNSMPVRDTEFFLYPNWDAEKNSPSLGLRSVAINRGASGIDGIISSATGYADANMDVPTTLLVGDLATLHDLNAFHTLARTSVSKPPSSESASSTTHPSPPLTTVIINNDGGGIFSFLPIAKHGSEVGFEDYFGTPTNSFSFAKGAAAFGLPYGTASDFHSFKEAYRSGIMAGAPNIVEAKVVGRDVNVRVHAEISKRSKIAIDKLLRIDDDDDQGSNSIRLPVKVFEIDEIGKSRLRERDISSDGQQGRTMLLLHGWMGDKAEWDGVAADLAQALTSDWNIIAIDLPGHGESPLLYSDQHQVLRRTLGLDYKTKEEDGNTDTNMGNDHSNKSTIGKKIDLSIDDIAKALIHSLWNDHGLEKVDAICGYSLGGRVALAMSRLSSQDHTLPNLLSSDVKMILIGSNPGLLPSSLSRDAESDIDRLNKDDALAKKMVSLSMNLLLTSSSESERSLKWASFLSKWYGVKSLWGELREQNPLKYSNMLAKRVHSLSYRAKDLASVLIACSPPRNSVSDWRFVNPSDTLFVAGSLDTKYSQMGRQWADYSPRGITYAEIPDAGHALLVEAPADVANIIVRFLEKEETEKLTEYDALSPPASVGSISSNGSIDNVTRDSRVVENQPAIKPTIPFQMSSLPVTMDVKSLDYEMFTIDVMSNGGKTQGVLGIGWGKKAELRHENKLTQRQGFIINLVSSDGAAVGIGEVSPLPGLHIESNRESEAQLILLKEQLESSSHDSPQTFDAEKILSLDGSLTAFIDKFVVSIEKQSGTHVGALYPSVRSGLEMAILSLASQACRLPVPQALSAHAQTNIKKSSSVPTLGNLLPLNGLATRGASTLPFRKARITQGTAENDISYPSMKVKVGHQGAAEDAQSIVRSAAARDDFSIDDSKPKRVARVRADANRAWDEASALAFAAALDLIDADIMSQRFEFIEEPLRQQTTEDGQWSLSMQIKALENWHKKSGMPYALDESLGDLVHQHAYDFQSISRSLSESFLERGRIFGCAAFVLKPSLLGLELSMRLARFAHEELGIGAVFSSSFDSGVGLAYTAFLGAVSDASPAANTMNIYPHGVGTFSMLEGDTLSPPFQSYVKEDGMLKISTLARALYGLGLDEMRESFSLDDADEAEKIEPGVNGQSDSYQATASTSTTGKEISVQVSLPLPFSDDIACNRFSDLPQQSRWSPWLNSVAYLDDGEETEWTLNVRGIQYRWRAVSKIIENPKGIMWESVSGLKNKGVVEFVRTSEESCLMKVKMSIITPRILASVFRGTSAFVEEFLQDKLLKWSLEMFRDVVKADLALERGDAELGDALFGAVEGKANAIEATLRSSIDD